MKSLYALVTLVLTVIIASGTVVLILQTRILIHLTEILIALESAR